MNRDYSPVMMPLVAHADWSKNEKKRWMSVATPTQESGWQVSIKPVGPLNSLLDRLRKQAGEAPIALGVDTVIGLPSAYRQSFSSFPAFLNSLSPSDNFFRVCRDLQEVTLSTPFYPEKPLKGQSPDTHAHRLGVTKGDLLRECEKAFGKQAEASSVFWTLGSKQVGRGAICLWRDVLIDALKTPKPPLLWPFAGKLHELLQPGRTVIAETYPANAMHQMCLGFRGSKRNQEDRRAIANRLRQLMAEADASPDDSLAADISDGFGPRKQREDEFDSLIGLIRMLQVIRNPALDIVPEESIRRWEGWILGRPLSIA